MGGNLQTPLLFPNQKKPPAAGKKGKGRMRGEGWLDEEMEGRIYFTCPSQGLHPSGRGHGIPV